MAEELRSRNVKITNFYDVAFDYILIDRYAIKRNLIFCLRVSMDYHYSFLL